jgi:hypothetical protein
MRISARSSLEQVAAAVGHALNASGIRAVLTGGGCAVLYAGGEYQSEDLDFIVETAAPVEDLDRVMGGVGFERRGDQYFHPESPFFVEFPSGPLGVGRDIQIKPVQLQFGSHRLLALSATDSCRDRLAAFFFWNDRQSLDVALSIASRNKVNLDLIRRWAEAEGQQDGFKEFRSELEKQRRARHKGRSSASHRKRRRSPRV